MDLPVCQVQAPWDWQACQTHVTLDLAELAATRVELATAKEEHKISQAKLEALSNSPKEFQEFFQGSAALTKMAGDMIFLAISNLYFLNLSKGKQVDFIAAFHLVLVPDFVDFYEF